MSEAPDAASSAAEESAKKQKKTSVACNTCRQKRQKCDGATPACSYCVGASIPCTYPDQIKRRGPPPGYFKNIEARVRILETFIGFLILQNSTPTSPHPNLLTTIQNSAHTFAQQLKDKDDSEWRECMNTFEDCVEPLTAAGLEGLNLSVIKLEDKDGATGSKRHGDDAAGIHKKVKRESSPNVGHAHRSSLGEHGYSKPHSYSTTTPTISFNDFDQGQSSSQLKSALFTPSQIIQSQPSRATLPDLRYPEPTQRSHVTLSDLNIGSLAHLDPDLGLYDMQRQMREEQQLHTHVDQPGVPSSQSTRDLGTWMDSGAGQTSGNNTVTFPARSSIASLSELSTAQNGNVRPMGDRTVRFGGMDFEPDLAVGVGSGAQESSLTGMGRQAFEVNYTSSFWRAVDAPYASGSYIPPTIENTGAGIKLPPKHVQNHLITVHFDLIHPIFPFLDEQAFQTYLNSTADSPPKSPSRVLLLALCAYSACFSPTLGGTAPDANILGGDSAGGVIADVWYEEARANTIGGNGLRQKFGVETLQTLMLLALRDQGRGQDSQAWIILGLAIRIAQDLGYHSITPTTEASGTKYRMWATLCALDLILSLQLGRPPAISHSFYPETDNLYALLNPSHPSPSRGHLKEASVLNLFGENIKLCSIISRVQSGLYMSKSPQLEEMLQLKDELNTWFNSLPPEFRCSLGQRSPVPVVMLHLMYHSSVVLLYRRFNDNATFDAVPPAMDAASAFNILLDSYSSQSSFSQCHPHLIFLVFTVAISFFFSIRRIRATSASFSASLTAQAALLKCVDALDEMSKTWPLATRCHKVLERLMEPENLEALSGRPKSSFGKVSPSVINPYEQADISSLMPWLQKGGLPGSASVSRSASRTGYRASDQIPPFTPTNSNAMAGPSNPLNMTTPSQFNPSAFDDFIFPPIDMLANTTGWGIGDFGLTEPSPLQDNGVPGDMESLLAKLISNEQESQNKMFDDGRFGQASYDYLDFSPMPPPMGGVSSSEANPLDLLASASWQEPNPGPSRMNR